MSISRRIDFINPEVVNLCQVIAEVKKSIYVIQNGLFSDKEQIDKKTKRFLDELESLKDKYITEFKKAPIFIKEKQDYLSFAGISYAIEKRIEDVFYTHKKSDDNYYRDISFDQQDDGKYIAPSIPHPDRLRIIFRTDNREFTLPHDIIQSIRELGFGEPEISDHTHYFDRYDCKWMYNTICDWNMGPTPPEPEPEPDDEDEDENEYGYE